MNEPLTVNNNDFFYRKDQGGDRGPNQNVDNNFFYKKDKGPNENVENEINHLLHKSQRKAKTIYILQITEFASIILSYVFFPSLNASSGQIITFSLLLGLWITIGLLAYYFMIFYIMESEEYLLLSNKRQCKGIVEVLQDYFYKGPEIFNVIDLDSKSWIDISGIFSIEDNSADKLYLVLFIKPNIQKYDKEGKLVDVEYTIPEYSLSSFKHYAKIGNNEPSFLKFGYFITFASLGLVGFYLYYVRCYIKIKDFTVKKLLNARDDLNTMKQILGYDKYIPGISINGKQFLYDSNLTGANREITKVVKNEPTVNNAEIELNYKLKVNI